jgi:hypothetical protein
MRRQHILLTAASVFGLLLACETPGEPDFSTSQKLDIQVLKTTEFQFLGGKKALIDTTKGDAADFFTTDPEGVVSISTEEDFDFGDLNNAIPEVSVDPTDVNAEVGELSLGSFASDSPDGLGRANFQQLTTLNPALFGPGTPLPGGSSPAPVNIDVSTDYFVSATIKSGALEITLRNTLGFNLSTLTLQLRSGATVIGTFDFVNLNHNSTITESLTLTNGTVLTDINMNVSISWNAQSMSAQPEDLIVQNVEGVSLVASEVEAVLSSQEFSTTGSFDIDRNQFLFEDFNDYVELSAGSLNLEQLVNNMDITIEDFILSFPNIRRAPYAPGDSLFIRFTGTDKITARRVINNYSIDMADLRLFAPNNEMTYNVYSITQDNQQGTGSTSTVVNETDNIFARVAISGLTIRDVVGTIITKNVDLNDDDLANGANIDLFNDNEANLISLDGIEDLSDKLGGLEFLDARLSITYQTNIGVPAKIVGSFVGVDAKGDQLYLTGKAGSAFEVTANPFANFTSNGTVLTANQMIQFELAVSPDGSMITSAIEFDKDNSSIIEFLNKLPVEIRFIGKAVINEDGVRGRIQQPVRFEPQILVDIPLSIQTITAAVYEDTLNTDMGSLPGPDDDTNLNSASINITYANRLPMEIDITLDFMDENYTVLTTAPRAGQAAIALLASPVDATGFVTGTGREGTLTIQLNRDQMDLLNRVRYVGLRTGLTTTNNGAVRIRAVDGFSMGMNGSFSITTSIN